MLRVEPLDPLREFCYHQFEWIEVTSVNFQVILPLQQQVLLYNSLQGSSHHMQAEANVRFVIRMYVYIDRRTSPYYSRW